MALVNVFVYGTLKKGEPNHFWLTNKEHGHAKYKGVAKTATRYPLVIGTKYNIPFLLYKPEHGHNVNGELYEVDELMLQNLDVLEDHPNFYIREMQDMFVVKDADGREYKFGEKMEKCWVYFLKSFKTEMLEFPFLEDYHSQGPHGLVYMDRYLRRNLDEYDFKADVLIKSS